MAELIQEGANFDIAMRKDNDLSFNITTGFDLTDYDYVCKIIPATIGSTEIPVVITPIDLSIGKLHFFISKESIAGLTIVSDRHRYYFNVNTPKQEVPAITVFTRTLMQGYFSVLSK
jgi:hypothetical protein